MIDVANKPLTAKQAGFVQYFCNVGGDTVNNAMQSALRAGYAYNTARNADSMVLAKQGVRQAIFEYRANTERELDWNRELNLQEQYQQIARYKAILKAHPGNLQAMQGLNQVLRELNASNGLHSQTVNTNNKTLAINVIGRSTGASDDLDPDPAQPALEPSSGTDEAYTASDGVVTGKEQGCDKAVAEKSLDIEAEEAGGEGFGCGGRGPISTPD